MKKSIKLKVISTANKGGGMEQYSTIFIIFELHLGFFEINGNFV